MRRPTPHPWRLIGAGAALMAGALLLWWAIGPAGAPDSGGSPGRRAAAPRPKAVNDGAPAAGQGPTAKRQPKPGHLDEDDVQGDVADEAEAEGEARAVADGPDDADTGGPVWDPSPDGQVAAIRTVMPDIKRCYDKWRPADGSLAGRLEVQWVIGGDTGAAAGAGADVQPVSEVETLSSDLEHPMMELCVKDALRALRFATPESGEPLVVKFPFSFQ